MKLAAIALTLLLSGPVSAQLLGQPTIEGRAELVLFQDGRLQSESWAQYYNAFGFPGETLMQGDHRLTTATGAIVLDRLQWSVTNGYYRGYRVGVSTPGTCYIARNQATAYPQDRPDSTPVNSPQWSSSTHCRSATSGGTEPTPGDGGCVETEWYACPPPGTPYYDDNGNLVCYGPCVTSPIIIGLDRGRYHLTDETNGVRFDLDADGIREQTAWTAPGEELAFLALDLNQNGTIDSARELFGDRTFMPDGSTRANGFLALAQHDSNGDGQIDASDRVWPALRLWVDANHDGVSQSSELTPVASSPVRGLALEHHQSGNRDQHGNLFRYSARARFIGGEYLYYDIFFIRN